jgi:hypothetical protein
MQYNKLGFCVFVLGILAFLGPLMLTWLGCLIWPGLLQLTLGDLRSGFVLPAGAALIVIGGLMNRPKDEEAMK